MELSKRAKFLEKHEEIQDMLASLDQAVVEGTISESTYKDLETTTEDTFTNSIQELDTDLLINSHSCNECVGSASYHLAATSIEDFSIPLFYYWGFGIHLFIGTRGS